MEGKTALVLFTLALVAPRAKCATDNCSSCGWSAQFNGVNCTCAVSLVLHPNGRDCRNASCTDKDCLQCDQPNSCVKCLVFIGQSSGLCLSSCIGSAVLQGDNLVCKETNEDDTKVSVIIAVFAGAGAGLLVCVVIIVAVCIYLRKKRRNINLQDRKYTVRQMETGHVKQYSVYDNSGFISESPPLNGYGKIDPLDYIGQLEGLRLHADTLLTLIGQLRAKTKAMNTNDPRVPTYIGMIHRLFRVLTLLNKKDSVTSVPSDAMSLIQWAYQMLEDFREQQLTTSETDDIEVTVAQISSVDVDTVDTVSPVYMTPESSNMVPSLTSPYTASTMPRASEKQYSTLGRKSGFATISRATSLTKAALLSSIEADEKNFSEHFGTRQQASSPPSSSGLSREDLQIFLINAPAANVLVNPSDDVRSGYSAPSGIPNVHSLPKDSGIVNGSIYSNPQKSGLHKQQPSQKKNIITNPLAGTLGKKTMSNYASPNKGYFANGHYYDPNPMPVFEPEIYAPGSNYSESSNVMSTFLGDVPRSVSSSDQSDFGDNTSENSGGDLEVFRFDLKDATEPVEV